MKKIIYILFLSIFLSNTASAFESKKKEAAVDLDKYALALMDSASYQPSNDIQHTYSFINKVLNMSNMLQDSTNIIVYMDISKICYSFELYQLSLECLFKALDIQDNIKSNDLQLYVEIYYSIGNSYLGLGNYENTHLYYQKAIKIIEENKEILDIEHFNYMKVYSKLAFVNMMEKNHDKARSLILKIMDHAKEKRDTLIYVRALRTLSNICFDTHDSIKGMEHLDRAIELAQENSEYEADLATLYIEKGYYLFHSDSLRYANEVIKYYKKSYDISLGKIDLLSMLKASTYNLYLTYKSLGDYKNALYYNEINQRLAEESAAANIEKQIAALQLESIHKESIKQLERKQEKTSLILYIVITCIFVISLLFYMLYRFQKEKVAKRKLQNEILQDKLDFKNKEFTSKALQILQINKILDKINKEIQDIIKNAPDDIHKKLLVVIKDLKANKSNLNWDEFEKLFIETNDDFYKRLTTEFPELTKNELRLCAFLKMNMTTKEISAITNQREQSITMARWRLRKKLNIENENINITNFLLKYTGEGDGE